MRLLREYYGVLYFVALFVQRPRFDYNIMDVVVSSRHGNLHLDSHSSDSPQSKLLMKREV